MGRKSESIDYATELFLLQQKRKKLKSLTRWEKFKVSIYDPERGEFLGKDCSGWSK